jgi:hypothetical protein
MVTTQSTFLCCGDVEAREALLCSASDSVSIVGGKVQTELLDSGSDAWLELFSKTQLKSKWLTAYVMIGDEAIEAKKTFDIKKIVVKDALTEGGEGSSIDDLATYNLLLDGKGILHD